MRPNFHKTGKVRGHNADLAFRFLPLPRVPLLLLCWDEAPARRGSP